MLKNIFPIDQNPTIIYFAQRPFFKIILVLIFAFFMANTNIFPVLWRNVAIATVAVITFLPKYRYIILFCGMFCLLLNNLLIKEQPDWVLFRANYLFEIFRNNSDNYFGTAVIKYIDLALMIVISETLIFLVTYYNRFRIFRYPITLYICLIFSLILVAALAPLTKMQGFLLWSYIAVMNHYFWFVGYTLHESRFTNKRNFLLDYARYLPVWGFTALPYGKGSIYLQQVEAKNSEEFAVTQLKGIKLIWWAFILYCLLHLYYQFEDGFKMPKLMEALHDYNQGLHYPIWKAWTCLIDRFFRMMLELTVTGHFFVACCRMCGFRILRNTYKPLQARTIAEYWNRYNYYFKELLVEFFFYPTFFKFFKKMPKLRMFCTTLSAATFGNIIFHFLLLTPVMMSLGLGRAYRGFLPYILYAVILGISIGFSQLRSLEENKAQDKAVTSLMSSISVLLFYCVLCLFNSPYQDISIMNNFKFFGSLFGFKW
ncbi:MAG: hypothetical protein V4501_08810 [Pseudomonadota bacterium]